MNTLLPFSLAEQPREPGMFPLYPYSVGHHIQFHHVRPAGFPVYQIFLTGSGSGLFRDLQNGAETTLEPGMAYAFPPDRGHEYFPLSLEPWQVAFIGFQGYQALALLEGSGLLPSSPVHPEQFGECWDTIGEIWQLVNQPQTSRQAEQPMQELSVKLYRLLLMLHPSGSVQTKTTLDRLELAEVRNEALLKAVGLINEHFTEPLLISNLAAAVGYSVQHFQRLFLQTYQVTPLKYLQNLRLQRAVQLMTEDAGLPVQDIAVQVGMETNYFIRLFRITYGCTPGAMRKRLLTSAL